MNRTGILVATGAALFATAARGQTEPQRERPPQAANQGNALEEIVVTAQKRSQNLQNVPIAITALTEQTLQRANIESAMDLTFATPALNFSQTAVFAQPFIRGVGTDSFSPGNEASVATYVDGVYIASMNANMFALNNVQRIEVLKGPQGTLYGRNSTGGLINVVTKTPTQDFELSANASYGNFNTLATQGYVAGGLAPGLAADFAFSVRKQGKGYYRNINSGDRVSVEDGTYLRSKIVADLDAVTVTLAADYSNSRNTLANTRQPAKGTVPALPAGSYSTVPGDYSNTFDDLGNLKDWGVSGNVSVDLGAVRIVSITAYRKTTGDQYLDGDDSALPFSDVFTRQSFKQFSQELQLLSPSRSSFDWILGLYYLDADAGWDPITVLANGVQTSRAFLFSRSKSIAGFAQATFHVGDAGNLTLGARYTRDEKDYRRSFAPGVRSTDSWNRPSWRISYDHRLSSQTLGYASYNRGYKSGVYNTLFGPPVAVNPETVDSFEVGLKNDLFDRSVRLNIAAFYTSFKDIQVRSQLPGNAAVSLQNAAAARIYGIDGELNAALGNDFQLQIGFSWIHGRYTSFTGAEIYVPKPTGGNQLTIGDASGNPLPRTPEFSGNIGLTYDHRLGSESRVYASANLYLSSDIPWEPGNRVRTKGYGVLNGTLGYAFPGNRFSVEVFGRNLTDERYGNYVVPSANADRTSYAQPRTYGVKIGVRY